MLKAEKNSWLKSVVNSFKLVGLKKNSDFLNLKKTGKRFWPSSWALFVYTIQPKNQIEFGLTVSRKVGNAVQRNKLKRWSRELFRELNKSPLSFGVQINVVFKPMPNNFYQELSFAEFEKVFHFGFRKMEQACLAYEKSITKPA